MQNFTIFEIKNKGTSTFFPQLPLIYIPNLNFAKMVRAAGPSAILYGVVINGLSEAALQLAHISVAAAAAPMAGARMWTFTLYGSSGTLGCGSRSEHMSSTSSDLSISWQWLQKSTK